MIAINNKQKHRLKKKLKRENPKLFWQTPLFQFIKLQYNGKALTLSHDNVEKMKLVSEDAYKEGRRELFLVTKNWGKRN